MIPLDDRGHIRFTPMAFIFNMRFVPNLLHYLIKYWAANTATIPNTTLRIT